MAIIKTTLEIYKDVTAGTTDATQNVVPAAGLFRITVMEGEAACDINCAVIVKFDGAPIWLTKGSSKRTEPLELTGDGVKKVELILDATDLPSGSVFLGGLVKVEQVT